MQLDFEDVLAGTLGRLVLFSLFLLSAIWIGSAIGGMALVIGRWDFSSGGSLIDFGVLWLSPVLLINLWIVPNVAFLAAMVVYLMISENIGYVAWGAIVGIESLFVMLGWAHHSSPAYHITVTWGAWLILLAMVEIGVWLVRQMRMNRWAREMAELSAENAMIRAEREARIRGIHREPSVENEEHAESRGPSIQP